MTNSTDVVIVGGGAAGVELCAEIARMAESITGHEPEGITAGKVQIHLIEGSPNLLPRLDHIYGDKFHNYMHSLGVTLHLDFEVVRVTPDVIVSHDHESVAADTVIWTAGIIAPTWLSKLKGIVTNPINQVVVDTSLRCQ